MNPAFPTREDLKSRGYSPESLELYDLWRTAHGEAQQMAAKLPSVFGDPPRPRITLHVARGYDDEWFLSVERQAELAALDSEQHWTDVTAEAVQCFQEYFAFSDAEGWRFYLPAFIYHYLAEFPLGGWDAVHRACVERENFDLLTPDQISFIDGFLELCRSWESR
jgi:hypothetical protein